MGVDINDLKATVLISLGDIVKDKEGLVNFPEDVMSTMDELGSIALFNTMFNAALEDSHIQKVLSDMIAKHMYKNSIKGNITVTLGLK
ncbi:MAG: hypothetical protein KAS32_29810 [Candidatus Peribacteraceae bacterium]|nr:hypothetical protein [Candidatus Peribacteraceae bacterium]